MTLCERCANLDQLAMCKWEGLLTHSLLCSDGRPVVPKRSQVSLQDSSPHIGGGVMADNHSKNISKLILLTEF